MKKVIIAIMLLILCACNTGNSAAEYHLISQEEAKKIMDEETGYVILDVRRQDEFDSGHIPGAICYPNESIDEKISETLKDKKQKILVYCRSGRRSTEAAEKLVKMGYENVYDFGGIIDWIYDVE